MQDGALELVGPEIDFDDDGGPTTNEGIDEVAAGVDGGFEETL